MKNINNKNVQIMIFTLIAIITLGVGYATISAINLVINGNATASPNNSSFSVRFLTASDNNGPVVSPNLSGNVNTVSVVGDREASFNVTSLSAAGDTAVATYKIKNESNGIGADISLSLSNTNSEYFKATVAVADSQLQAGDMTEATVTVELLKTIIDESVSTTVTATLIASPTENDSATGNDSKQGSSAFELDSWSTIKTNIQNGNTSQYKIGDTRKVTINNTSYTVRLANKSTIPNCWNSSYSETACGFVVEFAEIVEMNKKMNSTDTNVGGWPGSELYAYLQGSFYNSLPNDLKSVIRPTRVISGYGDNGTDSVNFTSTDNLYLLSGVEVFGADDYDTSAETTHQLEYYQGMEADATTPWSAPAYSKTYKGYNGSDGSTEYWWLRPAASGIGSDYCFRGVGYGSLNYAAASNAGDDFGGLAPAFRIG